MKAVHVRIFYPADPLGVVAGGIDTFIRGVIKSAPPDLRFSLVGMTTEPDRRPIGQWTRCDVGDTSFDFYPLVAAPAAGERGRVPLSVRYTLALRRSRSRLTQDAEVFDFHRVEPALALLRDRRPKNAYFHQDPEVLRSAGADILWRRVPSLYERLEARVFPRLASAWCVRESGVRTLAGRYPAQADDIRFLPTWVDPDVFSRVDDARRERLRRRLARRLYLDPDAERVVFVGRLDSQKDPMLLLGAVARLREAGRHVQLLLIGDGVLRASMKEAARRWGIKEHVRFLGLCKPDVIANVLRASDAFALSSAYEGMPISMLEAMACGLPVASTDVGEVRRLVQPGVNGMIAASRDVKDFADCLAEVLDHREAWRGDPAVNATLPYRPDEVLAPVYEHYRELGDRYRRWLAGDDSAYRPRYRASVLGVPVDAIARNRAHGLLMQWALSRQSRYVCFCNVHSLFVALGDSKHRRVIEDADMAAPDGAPVAWTLTRKGFRRQVRIDGPSKMWTLCREAETLGIRIGLYGSTPATLERLRERLEESFPKLVIAYAWSPPFRPLSPEEDEAMCREVNESNVGFLFVGLGCPKQEAWMAAHRGRIQAVMLGVGAAFDFHAGLVSRAPAWVQSHGLEWLHRLIAEPRRLWRRYLVSNSAFLWRTAWDMMRKVASVARPERRATSPSGRYAGVERRRAGNREMHFSQMTDLRLQIEAALPAGRQGRVVGFIASSSGEGTSTLARSYVRAATEGTGRRVLLLSESMLPGRSVLHALAQGDEGLGEVRQTTQGWWLGSLLDHDGPALEEVLLQRDRSWIALRRAFDEIVVDMPAASRSRAGLLVAPHCDGIVLVLEAEKTRGPVVDSLVSELRAVRAHPLGVVLNKRRFHLPAALYRWL